MGQDCAVPQAEAEGLFHLLLQILVGAVLEHEFKLQTADLHFTQLGMVIGRCV